MTKDQFQDLLTFLERKQQHKMDHNPLDDPTALASTSNVTGTFCLLSHIDSSSWIIDSGASDHMCNNHTFFLNLRKLNGFNHTITIPDGRKVRVRHIGDLQLTKHILLHNVLYVPEFQFSLISVPKLCFDLNVSLLFSANKCIIQGLPTKEIIVLGSLKHGLYYADNESTQATTVVDDSCMLATDLRKKHSLQQAKLMHLRLGHLSIKQLHILYPDIDSTLFKNSFICTICPAAKLTRKSFPLSSIKTTTSFQIIHLDIWGPYSKTTYNACTFFLTIVMITLELLGFI